MFGSIARAIVPVAALVILASPAAADVLPDPTDPTGPFAIVALVVLIAGVAGILFFRRRKK